MKRPFADSSTYYRDVLRIIRIAGVLFPLSLIPIGLLIRTGYLDGQYYAGDGWFAGTALALLGLSGVQYWLTIRRPIPQSYLWVSVGYHVLGALFILSVSGISGPAIIGWLALMVAVDTYFGAIAFMLSAGTLVLVALLITSLYGLTPTDVLLTWLYCVFLIVVGAVLSRIRAVTDRERYALVRSREDENFQRERLLALVNSMGDAVIATDEQGSIKVYNAAALNLLDTNASLNNKKIDRVLRLYDDGAKRINALDQAKSKHQVFARTDLTHKFSDGEQINLYINFSPIQLSYQSAGEKGYIFILRDITKEKSLEEERDEFISVVSHELRTPVAIVEGDISNVLVLQQRGADQKVLNHALEDAHDQIMYLAKMINDLSTLSRAERGLDSTVEEIDTTALLHEIYKNYQDNAAKKGLALDLNIQARLPRVSTSRLYLEEILQNLLTNAIKYTKSGTITLQAHHTRGTIVLAVSDTGIGISKSDQRHIFEKFYRSEDYRTRETNGTGLGLYVSKKLADKMGAAISFESRLNHGSTFSLTIPVKK